MIVFSPPSMIVIDRLPLHYRRGMEVRKRINQILQMITALSISFLVKKLAL